MVIMLVPCYLYWYRRIYIDASVLILCRYLYWCHGIYIVALVFILVPWYLYWCHRIYMVVVVIGVVVEHLDHLESLVDKTN